MPTTTRAGMRISGGLVLAAVIAACGGSTASTAPASQASSAAPPASAAATDGSQSSPTAPTPAESFVVPTLGTDTPLIDVLPAEVGGAATTKLAVTGSDLSAFDASTAMVFEGVLGILKVNAADMTMGIASTATSSIVAIRVKGATAQQIGDAMIAGRALNATTTKDEIDLGGKHVVKVTTTTSPLPFYVYAKGDVSFTIAAADESIVAEALSKLP
jgi:hypothetical protein